MSQPAVVLLSGGLDSATTLLIARDEGFIPYALSFDYGQKQRAELEAARHFAKRYDVEHHVVSVDLSPLCKSALTRADIAVPDHVGDGEVPVTYVPGRNIIFLSMALAWAESLNTSHIYLGASQVDYSGYPDCRAEFFSAFTELANCGTQRGTKGELWQLHTPLLHYSKAETIQWGLRLGVDYQQTVSCYQATLAGEACGRCDSCTLRRQGFLAAGVPDPTRYTP